MREKAKGKVKQSSLDRRNYSLITASLFYPGVDQHAPIGARRGNGHDRRSEFATAIRYLIRMLPDATLASEIIAFVLASGGVAGCATLERVASKSPANAPVTGQEERTTTAASVNADAESDADAAAGGASLEPVKRGSLLGLFRF